MKGKATVSLCSNASHETKRNCQASNPFEVSTKRIQNVTSTFSLLSSCDLLERKLKCIFLWLFYWKCHAKWDTNTLNELFQWQEEEQHSLSFRWHILCVGGCETGSRYVCRIQINLNSTSDLWMLANGNKEEKVSIRFAYLWVISNDWLHNVSSAFCIPWIFHELPFQYKIFKYLQIP